MQFSNLQSPPKQINSRKITHSLVHSFSSLSYDNLYDFLKHEKGVHSFFKVSRELKSHSRHIWVCLLCELSRQWSLQYFWYSFLLDWTAMYSAEYATWVSMRETGSGWILRKSFHRIALLVESKIRRVTKVHCTSEESTLETNLWSEKWLTHGKVDIVSFVWAVHKWRLPVPFH